MNYADEVSPRWNFYFPVCVLRLNSQYEKPAVFVIVLECCLIGVRLAICRNSYKNKVPVYVE